MLKIPHAAFLVVAISIATAAVGQPDDFDETKYLLIRQGIDDLGVTVEKFFRDVRSFKTNGASMSIKVKRDDHAYIIHIKNESRPSAAAFRLRLVPSGERAYYLQEITYRNQESIDYRQKFQLLALYP